jgi:transglutaminase-like putative cysteine protease
VALAVDDLRLQRGVHGLEQVERASPAIFTTPTSTKATRRTPAETLETKTGACRDFAMVLIEAARYLGFGARFGVADAEQAHGITARSGPPF